MDILARLTSSLHAATLLWLQAYSADLLCSALAAAGVTPAEMLRLNDPRRHPYTAKDEVLRFCCLDDATRMFSVPQDAWQRRVVVATCSSAGAPSPPSLPLLRLCRAHTSDCACCSILLTCTPTLRLLPAPPPPPPFPAAAAALLREGLYSMQPVLFSHVLIDEAGQALPTEALIPLSLLAFDTGAPSGGGPGYGAVLCGDPRQLGPVVRSQVKRRRCWHAAASVRGLGWSTEA